MYTAYLYDVDKREEENRSAVSRVSGEVSGDLAGDYWALILNAFSADKTLRVKICA